MITNYRQSLRTDLDLQLKLFLRLQSFYSIKSAKFFEERELISKYLI